MFKMNIFRLLIITALLMGVSSALQADEDGKPAAKTQTQSDRLKRDFELNYYDRLDMFKESDDTYSSALSVLGTNRSGELSMALASPHTGIETTGLYPANDWTLESTTDGKLLLTLEFSTSRLQVEFYVAKSKTGEGTMRMNVKENTFYIHVQENPPDICDLKFKGHQDVLVRNMSFRKLEVGGDGVIWRNGKALSYEQAKAAFAKALGR